VSGTGGFFFFFFADYPNNIMVYRADVNFSYAKFALFLMVPPVKDGVRQPSEQVKEKEP
jgi:hypothetical protein